MKSKLLGKKLSCTAAAMAPRRIPDEEWNLYKEKILELFPKLERSQILEHLSREYGFCPTLVSSRATAIPLSDTSTHSKFRLHQYEYQKKRWGLLKNKTQKHWNYIDSSVENRHLDGKDSKIVAHGSLVTMKQLRRARKWVRRSGSAARPSTGKPLSPYLLCIG